MFCFIGMNLRNSLLLFVYLALLLVAGTVPVLAAETKKEPSQEEILAKKRAKVEQERKANRKKIAKRFPGYGRHSKAFKSLCEAIALDGRNYFFREVGQANNVKHENCKGCKDLYKQFSKSCRPKITKKKKKKKKKKKDDDEDVVVEEPEEPKVAKKQLEPHVIAIQRASEIGFTLKADTRWMHEHYVAFTDFEKRLEKDKSYSHGERRYAGLLLEAVLSHFFDYRRALEKSERRRSSSRRGVSFLERDREQEAKELEELFDGDL